MKLKLLSLLIAVSIALPVLAQAPTAEQEQQKKQITDPAEYNAYVAALNEASPAKKAQMLDEFLTKFPNTVVKEDALELRMVALQQAGQSPEPAAKQLLQLNPNNLRALILMSYFFTQTLNEKDPAFQQKLAEGEQNARRGLQQLASFQPANVSPADLEQTKKGAETTFRQALGTAAMARKQYDVAQAEFRKAAELSPDDGALFYRIGNAYIYERPAPKYTEALWAFARSAMLEGPSALPPAGRQQVADYLKKIYAQYHGSEEGLEELKQQAKVRPFPAPDFKVKSKAEIAAESPPEVEKMGFVDIREVLAAGGPKADQLWERVKGKSFTLKGMVVSATPAVRPRTVRVAVLEETANKPNSYDVELALTAPGTRLAPRTMIQFDGLVNTYTPSPFSLGMVDGKISVAGGAAPTDPAAKKAGAAKKRPARKRG